VGFSFTPKLYPAILKLDVFMTTRPDNKVRELAMAAVDRNLSMV
jgi:hypothetical protein